MKRGSIEPAVTLARKAVALGLRQIDAAPEFRDARRLAGRMPVHTPFPDAPRAAHAHAARFGPWHVQWDGG